MNQGGWQPIETAPRDGSDIIAWDGADMAIVYWRRRHWALRVSGTYAEDDYFEANSWRPAPLKPAAPYKSIT